MTTNPDLDAIATRAASLHEYAILTDQPFQAEADQLTGTDVPALLAEVRRLRKRLAEEERLHEDTIKDRDRFHDMADKLAYAVAPEEVIGEHSSMNCPWENALDLITPMAEVDKLRTRVTELEQAGTYARSALAALCYDLEDPGTNALGALYEISRATTGVEAPRDDAALALAKHASEVLERTADLADPEPPEASFFGDYGPQVADWLRRRANDAVRNTDAPAVRSAAV